MGTTSARSAYILLSLVMVCSATAWAQTATTSVLGQVTDQQGAAIVAAKVTVTNAATGLLRPGSTDAVGSYRLTSLPPGRYNIRVEMTGFRAAETRDVELLVNTATRLDFILRVGTREEMVDVKAEPERLNTTDASIGHAFGEQQIRNLPLEGRNVVGLLSLQPGAVFAPTTVEGEGIVWADSRQGSVNGSHGDQTNITLDGVDVNDPNGYAYTSALRITLDSIQEFRVTTTNYGADQGRSTAAQVALVTKSGSNAFHGSAYAYHRNTAWSSNTYFNKASQLWNADHGVALDNKNKPPLLQKTIWGGSLGGPVKRDGLFFFFNVENLRDKRENSVQRDVPSDTFRDGVLLYSCADPPACPPAQVQGLSGATHNIAAGQYGISPAQLAQLDPLGIGANVAASQYFSQYPHPNATGQNGYNFAGYRWAAPLSVNQYTYTGRLDFKLDHSGRHTLTWRGNLQDDHSKAAPVFPGQDPESTGIGNSRGMMLGYTAALSPHLINSFRYGYTRIGEATSGPLNGPSVQFRGLTKYGSQIASSTRLVPIHNFVDDLTWNHGRHTLQFGANIRFIDLITSDYNNTWPTYWANAYMLMDSSSFLPGSACPAPQTAFCLSLPLVSDGAIPSSGGGTCWPAFPITRLRW